MQKNELWINIWNENNPKPGEKEIFKFGKSLMMVDL